MKAEDRAIHILIADTQILVIEGLKTLLRDNYHLNGIVSSVHDLRKSLREKVPDVLILDYFLLDFGGYEELKSIKSDYPGMGIILLTNTITRNELVEMNQSGIRNILHKGIGQEELYACLDAVRKNKKYYSDFILDIMLESNGKKEFQEESVQLTVSEVEILRLIAEGLTNKEIAVHKVLSVHTIMTHRKNILRKLGVSNASELIMAAIRKGLIDNIEYHI